MAFQQPQQRPQSSRQLPAPSESHLDTSALQLQQQSTIEESQEWVLFSPQPPSVTERTHTTSTDRTPRTAGLSRLSDFGSLDTAALSGQTATADDDIVTHHGTEDDDELNSLDEGLHAFHEPSDYSSGPRNRLDQSGGTVLPTHDGLGTFQASSENVQNQLWQFERYNPRRVRQRRRSSLTRQLDRLDEGQEWTEDNEKTRRIEKWRIEQSIALLEEIERETRKMRRMSKANASRSRASSVATIATSTERRQSAMPGGFPGAERGQAQQSAEQESFWSRFTKRILRDLMGLDENILSVILGEELPPEAQIDDGATEAADIEAELQKDLDTDLMNEPWEHRILERIARELGVLVNHLTEHPGAFSTYLRTQELPAYAGLPTTSSNPAAIPDEAGAGTPTTPGAFSSVSNAHNPYFPPTVQVPLARANNYSEASLWGIEEEEEDNQYPIPGITDEADRLRREKEFWEKELDVKMVFDFLKKRFGTRAPQSPSADFHTRPRPYPIESDSGRPHRGTGVSTPITSARRQAMIRQHHPLVGSEASKAHQRRREREREMLLKQQHYGIPQHMRSGSGSIRTSPRSASIASQTSAKSSKRKRSLSGGSGKSRNFWDVGGSQVGSNSGIGVWGEV